MRQQLFICFRDLWYEQVHWVKQRMLEAAQASAETIFGQQLHKGLIHTITVHFWDTDER